MGSAYYAAGSALMARMQELDAIANNLANVGTTGYRGEKEVFSAVLARANGTEQNRVANTDVQGATTLDLSQGALQKTGNPLDLAIQGPGFFAVQTAKGEVYTRDGSFQVSAKNQLVTAQGDPVLGDGGPITMPAGPVTVSPNGTISVNGAVSGRLKVVDFPGGTQIESIGETYYTAPAGKAAEAPDAAVQQGALESSNVNPIMAMVQLVTTQRSAQMMQNAMGMFDKQMDKIATEDLPKVG